mmetsp:Transcript_55111/g.130799  ORF Transcript_55111/g.130799 Transcript_55111/m.130799 type:complete len:413 (-) Transcript_55111:2-1240(-)
MTCSPARGGPVQDSVLAQLPERMCAWGIRAPSGWLHELLVGVLPDEREREDEEVLQEHVHRDEEVVEARGGPEQQPHDVGEGVLGAGVLIARFDLRAHLQLGCPGRLLGAGHRAAHDQPVPADAVVPRRADARHLHVLEPRLVEPIQVFRLGGEEHPRVREKARNRVRGEHRPDHARLPARLENTVRLADPTLGLRPVLDTASRDVAILAVRLERQFLGIALDDGHALERVLGARLGQLVRRLVHQHQAGGRRARLKDADGAESSAATHVDHVHVRANVRRLQRRHAHVVGPVTRVDNVVVHDREVPVEPERLRLVLDEAQLRERTLRHLRVHRATARHGEPERPADCRPHASARPCLCPSDGREATKSARERLEPRGGCDGTDEQQRGHQARCHERHGSRRAAKDPSPPLL